MLTETAEPPVERDRKLEHIRLAMESRMQLERRFFDDWAFDHEALPELDLAAVDTSARLFGKRLAAPLLVSCMTGGTAQAARINRHLAEAAERAGIALGVGSQRRALEDVASAASFEVRSVAPTIPVLANLGAVQLNYGFGLDECRRAVEMIEADALVLHLNPLQEAIQPEGQGDFRGLLDKIGELAARLPVPVVVKEIGCGISERTARALVDRGIRVVDVAGLGGTSWARIEASRADDLEIGEVFADWGIPTPDAIARLAGIEGLEVIGSGGVRTGIDVAKAIALGASLAGLAQPFLAPALEGAAAVEARIARTVRELRITMFCVGAGDVPALGATPIRRRPAR